MHEVAISSCTDVQEWPESERLKEALLASKFDRCYTMPGLKISTALPDLMASALQKKFNKTINRPTVAKNLEGVHLLIADGHLRAAANLTAELLTEINQGFGMAGQSSTNTEYSFKVWACRLQLLMALKFYTLLNDELLPFEELDAPDLYYQYYPNLYPEEQKGSLVLFSMRLIHAEALRFTPLPWAALERIDRLELNVNKILANSVNRTKQFYEVWNNRLLAVQQMRARTLFFLKEYTTSMLLYSRLSKGDIDPEQRIALKLLLVRMAIAVGDKERLERHFSEIAAANPEDQILHRCLKCVFYGNYKQAYEILQENKDCLTKAELCNNMAVCLLYEGQVTDAIETLKNCSAEPNEPIVVNFFTIAKLSVSDFSQQKIAFFAQQFDNFPDMFDPLTLKLKSA